MSACTRCYRGRHVDWLQNRAHVARCLHAVLPSALTAEGWRSQRLWQAPAVGALAKLLQEALQDEQTFISQLSICDDCRAEVSSGEAEAESIPPIILRSTALA